ncbi:hypothetical protein Cgig2_021260 [Carnegiea gigantea]|uniref:Uncharacterized protein n=1 Tax=Carnegiea gigantea TaxID=171969 RepID=A0A9Q1JZW9_9CARY|nr:hypothetical protein Cgig2_021260 [Carnegiea gigantea]
MSSSCSSSETVPEGMVGVHIKGLHPQFPNLPAKIDGWVVYYICEDDRLKPLLAFISCIVDAGKDPKCHRVKSSDREPFNKLPKLSYFENDFFLAATEEAWALLSSLERGGTTTAEIAVDEAQRREEESHRRVETQAKSVGSAYSPLRIAVPREGTDCGDKPFPLRWRTKGRDKGLLRPRHLRPSLPRVARSYGPSWWRPKGGLSQIRIRSGGVGRVLSRALAVLGARQVSLRLGSAMLRTVEAGEDPNEVAFPYDISNGDDPDHPKSTVPLDGDSKEGSDDDPNA